jgi:hypothetical protein
METNLQQEILLMTGTNFTSRQCWQKINPEKENPFSEADELQDACWNGLLKEMLPEICEGNKKLYLWQIRENKSCIDIELGELPSPLEAYFSIDPYTFLTEQSEN